MVPLQFGIPGAMELAVLVLMFALLAIPVAAVLLVFGYLRRIDRKVDRVEERLDDEG